MAALIPSANAAGSGTMTLAGPSTNSNRTINIPDVNGTFITTATAGTILQVVNYQTGAVMTGGASTIAYSDAIPTNTQGTEFFTLAITPTSATSKLVINFSTVLNHTVSTAILNTCLFQDSISGALTVASSQNVNSGGLMVVSGSHYMTAGTTSSTTFKIRCGSASSATVTLNGVNGSRFYGGTSNSYITIMEIAA